jgi:hypothetical protein
MHQQPSPAPLLTNTYNYNSQAPHPANVNTYYASNKPQQQQQHQFYSPSSMPPLVPSAPVPSQPPPMQQAVPFFNPLMQQQQQQQNQNLFSDPVANMAMKYGSSLADQGKDYVTQNVDKWFALSKLKYYFAVDTTYVAKKLALLAFPFR